MSKVSTCETGQLPQTGLLYPGFIADLDAMAITYVCGALGAARARASDAILPAVGLELKTKVGDPIEKGQVWAEMQHECQEIPVVLRRKLEASIVIEQALRTVTTSRIIEMIQ